ncbi:tyrosine-protein phosphatase 69D isoform X2 [Anopheles darlingi]|uniref:tyrosine-protein phosphatase 69D isoform X2 n=1 Tax=Anopheles darlingi TaxID=43151 RepID=UPI0021002C81|nr:tyrosine-protein phosphatase 69D isoform X2 [Anopheles darlingi]
MWKGQAALCWLLSVVYVAVVCQLQVAANDNQVLEEYFNVGDNGTLPCAISETHNIIWQYNGQNITDARISFQIVDSNEAIRAQWPRVGVETTGDEGEGLVAVDENKTTKLFHTLTIRNYTNSDEGNYTCYDLESGRNTSYVVRTIILPKIVATNQQRIKTKSTETQQLYCVIKAFPLALFNNSIYWWKEDAHGDKSYRPLTNNIQKIVIDETRLNTTLTFENPTKAQNGTYSCTVEPSSQFQGDPGPPVKKSMTLLVLDVPQVTIDYAAAVGASKIYLNWTVNDGNDPIKNYIVTYRKAGDQTTTYYREQIAGNNSFYVLDGFNSDTDYMVGIGAINNQGASKQYTQYKEMIRTLKADPSFTPVIDVTGSTPTSITIRPSTPPTDLTSFIHYYEAEMSGGNGTATRNEITYLTDQRFLSIFFKNLEMATEYSFRARACSELTKLCGNWSESVNGTTSDGPSSPPRNMKISCTHYNITRRNVVHVRWDVPESPNGKITTYQATMTGVSHYNSEYGEPKKDTWGPKVMHSNPNTRSVDYDNVPPNTNYTVTIAAHTRSRRPGAQVTASCTMPPTTPNQIGRITWGKRRDEEGNWIFKVVLPRLTERNGPICCYKIYLTRLNGQHKSLPDSPEMLHISSYAEVHASENAGGTYLAEVFTTPLNVTDAFVGDGKNNPIRGLCQECLHLRRSLVTTEPTTTTPQVPSNYEQPGDEVTSPTATVVAAPAAGESRTGNEAVAVEDERKASSNHGKRDTSAKVQGRYETIQDGLIDDYSNYTGFVEVVVQTTSSESKYVSVYSEYFKEQSGGPHAHFGYAPDNVSEILHIIIQVLCALIAVVLCVLLVLCFLHRHFTNNIAQEGEAISLGDSLSSAKPPVLPPISKDDLPKAYNEKHKDSDYGFQHEFELLPDKFIDRTTKNSDMKENMPKNRYPDIKAYDQTRVKLMQLNGLSCSDYINANFVIGYKERKKFICAQGPMDATINDFWRMIWEQHLELIVMLTNLEEYNKTKCAKYWPECTNDSIQYGDLLITFQSITYHPDYIIRTLKVTKRSASSGEETSREISQYHYLAWKDFMAPEHPQGITKFINRINSEYSLQRGPILVHCSAGVGRTGTFVALDTLMQQLHEEGQVFIFNTVCDMRYQRNFLVQSLKQYIFLYRALAELAYFGDTEIDHKSLASTVETLKQPSSENVEISRLEHQFQRLKAFQEDTRKTTTIGSCEENKKKNRSEACIPYDKNRVILAPIPGRDNCTYINASFIDGYDDENYFIVTQDPMEDTIFDFWRMILEQRVKTIVMFSEIGDGPNKCPRYWADEEMKYEHLLVTYIQSESGPYYTKREFTVTNCKTNDMIAVTQFQYNGWPTVEGEVPEVTRGMIEIVNQAQKHCSQQQDIFTIAVHCSLGTDKSSLFVAMCILVMQLKTEKRVDICTVVRKLRAQRSLMIQTFAQYEFLHRAIVNFADLYKITLGIANDC